ncbi:MAG TPA: FtsQ-type POTRA domain-containing protein [Patescibacteria group bacterium]|nr:FtsQ-type POTRA domain-containing protein [Patescibacteria group bacterium]
MIKRNKKCIKPDYQAKNLKNPFYRKKKETSTGKWWWLIVVIVILMSLTWLLLLAPFFNLKNIEISGLKRLNDDGIMQMIETKKNETFLLIFKKTNFFLFSREELIDEISSKYNFSQITVKKVLPDTLKIELSERPYSFIFQEGDNFFYTSKDGYIIKDEPVTEEDKSKYFILENKSEIVSINLNLKINLNNEYLNFVFAIKDNLDLYQDLTVEKFIIEQELNSLIVDFKDGPIVYFNTQKDAKQQVDDLALVKKEKIRDNFNIINYIDLRYGEMIYIN